MICYANRTPISAVAAFTESWPLSHEMCVVYAMIMSLAGERDDNHDDVGLLLLHFTTHCRSRIAYSVLLHMYLYIIGIGSITTLTVLALWRCTLVVCCPANRHLTGTSSQLGHGEAALLSTVIWTYATAVTCPPLLGWGRYDLEAAHIR